MINNNICFGHMVFLLNFVHVHACIHVCVHVCVCDHMTFDRNLPFIFLISLLISKERKV